MCMKLSFHAQCPKRFLICTEARGTVERIELGGIHLFESTCRSDMSQGVCSTCTNLFNLYELQWVTSCRCRCKEPRWPPPCATLLNQPLV